MACSSPVYLSEGKQELLIQLPLVHLFTCGRLGTTVFGQVAYALSYLIMSDHIEFTNSGHAACVSELPH